MTPLLYEQLVLSDYDQLLGGRERTRLQAVEVDPAPDRLAGVVTAIPDEVVRRETGNGRREDADQAAGRIVDRKGERIRGKG